MYMYQLGGLQHLFTLLGMLFVFLFATPATIFAAGTPAAPEYIGGADGGGLTNSGSASLSFGSQNDSKEIAVQGNYAFVLTAASSTPCSQTAGHSNGCELKVFDISDPANPVYVGGGDASGSTNSGTGAVLAASIVISGNYAYTLWSFGSGCSQIAGSAAGCELKVWDISDPAEPTYVGGADASGSTNAGSGSQGGNAIAVSGNYVYTMWEPNSTACSQTAGSAVGCELKVFDISTPSAPVYVGGGDVSGLTNAGTGGRAGLDVSIAGDYAYTMWWSDNTECSQTPGSAIGCELKVWDITDPAEPTYVAGGDASGSTNAGTGSLIALSGHVSGEYLYTAWNLAGATCSQTPGSALGCELKVWDISDPTQLSYVGGADASGATNAGSGSNQLTSVYVSGTYAYTTWGANSITCSQTVGSAAGCELKVWDISNPAEPTYVGGGDSSGSTNSGTGSVVGVSVIVNGAYAYTGWMGNATTCSQTPGSAIGCELKVWHIGDTEAPTVSLTAPADNATLTASTSVTISASSSDNINVAGVSFYIDNVRIGSEDTSAPYSVTWDSTAGSSGSKTIIAVARDDANNYATSSARTVTVANEPGFSNVTATPGATSATITWTTTAAASSRVFFGVVDSLASSTPEINTGGGITTSHSVTISNLPSCTSFKYLAVSTNSGADTATSSERTFATTGCTGSASIATSTGNTVTTAAGGTFTHDALTLTVPTAFTSTSSAAVFQANQLDGTSFFATAGTPPGKNAIGNKAFALVALVDVTAVLSTFSNALTIAMTYDASDVEDIDESSLAVYRYDGASWSSLSNCSVDTNTRTVTCETTQFSDFALFGDPVVTDTSGPTYSTRVKRPEPATPKAVPEQILALINQHRALLHEAHARGLVLPQYILDILGLSPATVATPVFGITFDRNLALGSVGEDVRRLQQFLNQNGYPVAPTGVGSPSNETDYYGSLTAAAVGRFQIATGVVAGATTPGHGMFGPLTRARVNELLRKSE